MPKWISVDDQLPAKRNSEQVRVWRDNGPFKLHNDVAVCTDAAQWFSPAGQLDDVTHWQPLVGTPDDPEPACRHPEDQLEAVECLEDVVVCALCGAVLLYTGGERPFRQLSACELEAVIFRSFQDTHEALESIESALYQAGKVMRVFDAIKRDNSILRAEREARHARLEEALKKKQAQHAPGFTNIRPEGGD